VRKVFASLYREGLVYRGYYIINWCPRCGTALSDIEVEHEDVGGHLWYLRYDLKDSDQYITVATTRPETMLGDTAVAVSPKDERYRHLVGSSAVLPLVGRELPIIADDFVDPEFGTGLVKVTPAHDPNDFEMGRRHGLPEINIFTPEAVVNAEGGAYEGLDRHEARQAVLRDLEKMGYVLKEEVHHHAVGHCYRCHTVIEPYLSRQWFVSMEPLAKPAIAAVEEGRITFVPERWAKTYFEWMYNIRDWCISRQLWWGHRIPAWYCASCGETIVSEEDPEACPCGGTLEQDPDVLDTWFSSGLWPFATLGWPEQTADLDFFYPTSVLVTAFDIIFFWVARMIMNGLHFMGDVPYGEVYITALIRDELGKKMSKSSGNVIDPLEVIDEYGCDALRFTLGFIAVPGRDVFLSRERIEGSRHFCNKIWNASRLVLMNLDGEGGGGFERDGLVLEDRWILSSLARLIREVDSDFEAYNFSEACKALHDFFWSDFCDWYLEMAKSRLYGEDAEARRTVRGLLVSVLEQFMRLAHPVMPFITEEVWQRLPHSGDSIMTAEWPAAREDDLDTAAEAEMGYLREVIGGIRRIRSELKIPPSRKVAAKLLIVEDDKRALAEANLHHLVSQARLSGVEFVDGVDDPSAFARGMVEATEIFVPLEEMAGFSDEIDRIKRELAKLDQDAEKSRAKLANPSFVEKAPAAVVEKEQGKLADLDLKMEKLREQLGILGAQ
jgi:valyl-tRNA synthetase